MNIYVASSWRNSEQPKVVAALREAGHEVYDFRHPKPGDNGFAWSDLEGKAPGMRADGAWQDWTPEEFRAALDLPRAREGFDSDMDALRACDACVLVLPSGRSAHLELGWAVGAGKRTLVLFTRQDEPELMYRMLDGVCISTAEVIDRLASFAPAASSLVEKGAAPAPEERCATHPEHRWQEGRPHSCGGARVWHDGLGSTTTDEHWRCLGCGEEGYVDGIDA